MKHSPLLAGKNRIERLKQKSPAQKAGLFSFCGGTRGVISAR